jgi:hypothetical protein
MDFSSTEHALTWFRDEYRNGTLDIRPPYQRAPVWADRQKNALVESILLQLPIPEVYIQQTVDDDGETTHAVVDGQQRIRTILQFIGGDADEDEGNDFVLDKLPAQSRWHGQDFDNLTDEERRQFWRYRLSVRILETESEQEVRDMFKRLNKYTMPLKPQELRNATYIGPFARLTTTIADESDYWAENSIVTAQSIRRMGDIEFVAELLIGVMHGPQGGSSAIIDEYYAQYEDYDDEFPEQRETRRRFNLTLELIQRLFPQIKKIRWRNKTDFYSLFVAIAHLLREQGNAPRKRIQPLRTALTQFAEEVEIRQADDDAPVSPEVQRYVRALTRGANDKARRGERHLALLARLNPVIAGS